jgi:hypothetical protein
VANAADVPCCDAEDDSTLSKHSLRKSCGLLPSSMYRSRSCDDEYEERVNTRLEKRGSLFETVRVSRLARALRLMRRGLRARVCSHVRAKCTCVSSHVTSQCNLVCFCMRAKCTSVCTHIRTANALVR